MTKKAHPWYISRDNSLCWYKSVANFVIRRNGKLSEGLVPDPQMPATRTGDEKIITTFLS